MTGLSDPRTGPAFFGCIAADVTVGVTKQDITNVHELQCVAMYLGSSLGSHMGLVVVPVANKGFLAFSQVFFFLFLFVTHV